MRNEPLHAYSLHQRPFQDKRTIYYLLTKEHGILHGIGKKGIPQFVPLTLFATGKKSLKILQQVNIADVVPQLQGQQQYAALYVNEITFNLLPLEDSVPLVYEKYAMVMQQLQSDLSLQGLKLVLRFYEQDLFNELGVAIDFEQDADQDEIQLDQWYYFQPEYGWIKNTRLVNERSNGKPPHATNLASNMTKNPSSKLNSKPLSGNSIIDMSHGISAETLDHWTLIHRQLIDHLFDYKPLQSRILWQQFYRYQH